MKKIVIGIVTLCLLYFIVGYILVCLKIFNASNYYSVAGIVGGVASAVSLLSLSFSKITSKDIDDIGLERFERVQAINNKLKEDESKLSLTKEELEKVKLQKQELEILVEKASIILFTKDQLKRNEDKVLNIINDNKELSSLLKEINTLKINLDKYSEEVALNEDIQKILNYYNEYKQTDKEQLYAKYPEPYRSIARFSYYFTKTLLLK